MRNWRQFINEAKNKDGKEQGADGKACWDGYKYDGTEDGKDKCVKINEENPDDAKQYYIKYDDRITEETIEEVTLETIGLHGEWEKDGTQGARIKATSKGLENLKDAFEKNGLQTANILDAATKTPA